ncbi:MAG: hypothetical protein Q8L15_18355 [Methylobacter sp.]|nr:hypothetical protein [Methylobacter sp.]
MAREKRVSVNVEDELDEFIKRIAQKNHIPVSTMYYVLIRDQAESIGFDMDECHGATVQRSNSV